MKRKMRTRYTFKSVNTEHTFWGDCPIWAEKTRRAWGDKVVETQDRVMFLTHRKRGETTYFR